MDIGQELMKKIRSQYGQLGQSGAGAADDLNKYSKALETKEATGAGSAGSFSGPLFGETKEDEEYCDTCDKVKSKCKCNDTKKVEATEATGASSSGQYSGPSFLAKSQSKKNWRGKSKTQIPGGKFVEVKKKCKTFPYCNQGDIKALKIFENKTLKKVINNLSKKYQVNENVIKNIILYEISLIK